MNDFDMMFPTVALAPLGRGIEAVYQTVYQSPLGTIRLVFVGEDLTGLWFVDTERVPFAAEGGECAEAPGALQTVKRWLDLYFAGDMPDFTPDISTEGSAFAENVWAHLKEIPYGKTVTYKEIATAVSSDGHHVSAQAVGGAVGHNPIALIIPCHRVVGADGSPVGYAGGLDRKEKLLRLERGEKPFG